MHSKIKFIKQAIKNYSQIWAVFPSSRFLAKRMVKQYQIEKAQTIVEFWAWTWVFTKDIFKIATPPALLPSNLRGIDGEFSDSKNIFIIEKDNELYKTILHKFPEQKDFLYNEDMLNLKKILSNKSINNIDLIISWIPFRSLPKEIFKNLMEEVLPEIVWKNTIFVQFSYMKNTKEMFEKYFKNIETEVCYLNIPRAFVFTCSWFKNLK